MCGLIVLICAGSYLSHKVDLPSLREYFDIYRLKIVDKPVSDVFLKSTNPSFGVTDLRRQAEDQSRLVLGTRRPLLRSVLK